MSIEREFLVKLCRPGKEELSISLQGIDWTLVFDLAEREGLSGFVYALLKGEVELPSDILEGFKSRYYSNVINNISLFTSLKPVLECLESNGITSVVFRGASLMDDVYPSLGMRAFKDIDLLIRETDFFKTINLLKKEGFQSCDPYISVLYNKHINIDLHTDFMTYSRVKPVRLSVNTHLSSVFERALNKEVQGVRFFVLHPEDALLSLAVHLQMHSFDTLIGFLDIARLTDAYRKRIDWERLFERANGMNLAKTLYYNLFLMPEEWKAFDASLIERLRSQSFRFGERLLLERLEKGHKIHYSGETFFLLNTKGLWRKLRFLNGILFPKEEVRFKTFFTPTLFFRFLIDRLTKMWKFFSEIPMRKKRLI